MLTLEQTLGIAGSSIGILTFILTGMDYLIRSWLQKHRDEMITSLNTQVADLHKAVDRRTEERDAVNAGRGEAERRLQETTIALTSANERVADLTEKVEDQMAELAELKEAQDKIGRWQKTQDNRINRVLKLQGAIWTQSVMKPIPKFVSRSERKTPIVSVLNLKGGVGKTTLTANLAWALSNRGYRVLLIDLDLQGSLSSMFLNNEEIARLSTEEECLFQHFLAPKNLTKSGAKRHALSDFEVPVPQLNESCRIVAASDNLAYAELSQTVRWLLRVGGPTQQWNGRHDGRMILRRALHRKGMYRRFDVVLLDCPPLINLCCSNALAASDTILIPVAPSPKAIERIPPLLQRIVEIRKNGVNPELNVLGMVVNRTDGRSLSPREEDLFGNLPAECTSVFGHPVDRFDTVIQQRVAIQGSEDRFEPPEDGHPLRKTFEALAQEFIKRLNLGEPRRVRRGRPGLVNRSGGTS